jgi:hypothetical protein
METISIVMLGISTNGAYSKIDIILGIHTDIDTILTMSPSIESIYTIDDISNKRFLTCINNIPIYIFRYPDGSVLANKKYIIGICIRSYNRKQVRCTYCYDSNICAKCLGTTEHGVYDVQKIINKITKMNLEKLCPNCFHENKNTLYNGEKCIYCNLHTGMYTTPMENLSKTIEYISVLDYLDDFDAFYKKNIRVYYMLNDNIYD